MSIVLQGSTSGSVTLQEPAIAGSTVLTLPAVSGTVITTGSPQSGSVLQVVQGIYSTVTTTTSTSYVDSGLSTSITPKFATSKILVMANGVSRYERSLTNIDAGIGLQIVRGSTSIYNHNLAFYTYIVGASSTNNFYAQFFMNYLDSPATTSSTTYKLQFRTYTGTAVTQVDSFPSSITLLEIAA